MKRVFGLLLLALLFSCLSCQSGIEKGRDPARNGYFLAEKMIEQGRYYDGLLLHRVNANFFSEYYYGKRSRQRIRELNDKLKESVRGRPKVEILKKSLTPQGARNKVRLTIVNNTSKWVAHLRVSVRILDSRGKALPHPVTGKKEFQRIYGEDIGPWGLVRMTFSVSGYGAADKVQAEVEDYTLKEASSD
jgi:hypothetical protein